MQLSGPALGVLEAPLATIAISVTQCILHSLVVCLTLLIITKQNVDKSIFRSLSPISAAFRPVYQYGYIAEQSSSAT